MTIGERLKQVITEAGYRSPRAFFKELVRWHKSNAISAKTFYHLLKDKKTPHERTLNQIAMVLDMSTAALRKGTTIEPRPEPGWFYYNDSAKLYTYGVEAPFLPLKLVLNPDGESTKECDDAARGESFKWVVVVVGRIVVVIEEPDGEKTYKLHSSQTLLFDARKPHYFKNDSKRTSTAHIIHYPRTNNRTPFF